MRKIIAIVALLCGATGAYAAEPQKWCTEGAQVITTNEGLILKVDGQPDERLTKGSYRVIVDEIDGKNGILFTEYYILKPCKD